jgi:hypothetical protein
MKIEEETETLARIKFRTVILMTEVVPGYYAVSTCK